MDKAAALSQQIIEAAGQKGLTIATAESFTGGGIAAALTAVAGAGEVFLEGVVAYAESAKCRRLGVCERSIERFTAVSEAVAKEMAEGERADAKADIALATTGYAGTITADVAGEDGGAYYIAIASRIGTTVFHGTFTKGASRAQNTAEGVERALTLLLDAIGRDK